MNPISVSTFAGEIGVARVDITPPLEINARNWGAAKHDLAESIHRPLTATVLSLLAATADPPLVLIAADLGWWKSREDEGFVRGAVLEAFKLPESHVLVSLSHTHAGPNLYREDGDKPGGEHIGPYLDELRQKLVQATHRALAEKRRARLSWRYGRCALAQNRDLPEPDRQRFIVGWNPGQPADDTVLVGRVEDESDGHVLATIVNYACHPTTLAWENRQISPDFPGALREVVEKATGSLCLFLQGASGDLGTAIQHGHDAADADRIGRRLGHAVLETLESWPDTLRVLDRVVESGAPLGVTRSVPPHDSTVLRATRSAVELSLKPLESAAAIECALETCHDRALRERLWRKRAARRIVGDASVVAMPLWLWRIGEGLLVAQPNEAYSLFQLRMRQEFEPRPVVVLNVTNGYAGYLPPREHYSRDQYSVWQTPFAAGALETLTAAALSGLGGLVRPGS